MSQSSSSCSSLDFTACSRHATSPLSAQAGRTRWQRPGVEKQHEAGGLEMGPEAVTGLFHNSNSRDWYSARSLGCVAVFGLFQKRLDLATFSSTKMAKSSSQQPPCPGRKELGKAHNQWHMITGCAHSCVHSVSLSHWPCALLPALAVFFHILRLVATSIDGWSSPLPLPLSSYNI